MPARSLTDTQLAFGIGLALLALTAWPLLLVDVPPFQDLPNHLATMTVIAYPERYPEFVFNGFFKTNGALFGWLYAVGALVGVTTAARLFTLLCLGVTAFGLPRLVLEITGSRAKLVASSFLMWPMIHHWFVSMGMLDFALGVALSIFVLVNLNRQRNAPAIRHALKIAVLAVLTWYAHVFPLLVVVLLVGVHVLTTAPVGTPDRTDVWHARLREARVLVPPLLPAILIAAFSVWRHVTQPIGLMTADTGSVTFLTPLLLLRNVSAQWLAGFTWLSASSLVPAVALVVVGYVHRRDAPTFFSPLALAVLLLFYVLMPASLTNWWVINSRFLPYLGIAALLRVPEVLPRGLLRTLALCAALYSAGMGVDYVRLDRDRAKFTAGVSVVPEGARLLPLIFRSKLTSQNTSSLRHAWGFYVVAKRTAAPLLFAHSVDFPVTYRVSPATRFNHLALETFAPSMASALEQCGPPHPGDAGRDDCEAAWRLAWERFWGEALPVYDHVLLWDAPPGAQAMVPRAYEVIFHQDRLTIYKRVTLGPGARE